ncbi:MAG: hypothetical protein Q4F65_12925, partial [Propionibacteriaceae bacterium]|nr:hypothetical protein [Propionibacteriaceae bacterium]
ITDKQLQMLNIALKEAGYDTDEARFGFLASGLGREVTSTRDLTKAEATAAINHLRGGESA